jgi:CYTH domain-containing protein
MQAIELERKWLVSSPPDLSLYKFDEIEQGYISFASSENNEVRIRRKSNQYYLTIKSLNDKSSLNIKRLETEIILSKEQYDLLWPITLGKRIVKRRYYIEYQNYKIELDLYKDSLDNFIIAEVEFSSELDANKFIPPSWFGAEVTSDQEYSNAKLALAYLQKTI